MYGDVGGQVNEQPFHLDGVVPWFTPEGGGKKWTTLSCVLQLCDGPSTVLGTLLEDFWKLDDEEVADSLNAAISKENSVSHTETLRRAGHVVIFPQGKIFFDI